MLFIMTQIFMLISLLFNVSNYLDNDTDVNAILNVTDDLNNDISSRVIQNDNLYQRSQVMYVHKLFCHPT